MSSTPGTSPSASKAASENVTAPVLLSLPPSSANMKKGFPPDDFRYDGMEVHSLDGQSGSMTSGASGFLHSPVSPEKGHGILPEPKMRVIPQAASQASHGTSPTANSSRPSLNVLAPPPLHHTPSPASSLNIGNGTWRGTDVIPQGTATSVHPSATPSMSGEPSKKYSQRSVQGSETEAVRNFTTFGREGPTLKKVAIYAETLGDVKTYINSEVVKFKEQVKSTGTSVFLLREWLQKDVRKLIWRSQKLHGECAFDRRCSELFFSMCGEVSVTFSVKIHYRIEKKGGRRDGDDWDQIMRLVQSDVQQESDRCLTFKLKVSSSLERSVASFRNKYVGQNRPIPDINGLSQRLKATVYQNIHRTMCGKIFKAYQAAECQLVEELRKEAQCYEVQLWIADNAEKIEATRVLNEAGAARALLGLRSEV